MLKNGGFLRNVLLLQKREIELRFKEIFVRREVDTHRAAGDLIKVILGPRRAGKSLLALHVAQALGPFGYVNFDDEVLSDVEDPHALLSAVDAVYGNPGRLLLDEVQNVPRWELLVNRLQRQGRDLILTGSNAHLLSSELATHLTGRHLPIVLFPFNFSEFLAARGGELTDAEKVEACREYAETGGYPEPLVKGIPHRDYLPTLWRSILYKDVVVRHRIRAPQGLEDLATWLLSNTAQRCNSRSLARSGTLRSAHTVDKYLRHLEEAFLLFPVRRFSFKLREQARSDRKFYGTDNGLITSTAFRFSPDLGKLYENLVAIALHRHRLVGALELFYWHGTAQEEVDFVVKKGLRVTQLIQVCGDIGDPRRRSRETRALVKASADLACDDLLLLTERSSGEEEVSWFGRKGTIRIRPVWQWLLEEGR
ncbi:MAG: ATP-binding protein [Planctomycetes bacterium]|nr:ATP-binding protein [Planctomycetota bacterium]